MCKTSLSTKRSQAVKTRCRSPNQSTLSLYATGVGQGPNIPWRLSQQSLIVALVIFGVLPDLTGVASISPAHRKHEVSHLQKAETWKTRLWPAFAGNDETTEDSRTKLRAANNYSLSLLPSEWTGRKGTSKEASSQWESPIYSPFYVGSKSEQYSTQISTNGKAAKHTSGRSTPVTVPSKVLNQPKGLRTLKGDILSSRNENERILVGASTQKSDSNPLVIDTDKARSGQVSFCPNCVGSSRLSFPVPAVTSSSVWSKLITSIPSILSRSRRSVDPENSKFGEYKSIRGVIFNDGKRKHFSNKIQHHSVRKRRKFEFSIFNPHIFILFHLTFSSVLKA